MRPKVPQIVALGGGGFSMEKDGSLLDDYVLSLTRAVRPRVCFLPTASGDADHYVVRFYRRFSSGCESASTGSITGAGADTTVSLRRRSSSVRASLALSVKNSFSAASDSSSSSVFDA